MKLGLWQVNGRIVLFGTENADWRTRIVVGTGDIILVYGQRDTMFSLDRPRWDGIARGQHVIVYDGVFSLLTWLPCDDIVCDGMVESHE